MIEVCRFAILVHARSMTKSQKGGEVKWPELMMVVRKQQKP